jgi:hypothetical protein
MNPMPNDSTAMSTAPTTITHALRYQGTGSVGGATWVDGPAAAGPAPPAVDASTGWNGWGGMGLVGAVALMLDPP